MRIKEFTGKTTQEAIDPAPQVGITAGNVDFVCSGEIAQHDFNT